MTFIRKQTKKKESNTFGIRTSKFDAVSQRFTFIPYILANWAVNYKLSVHFYI